MMRNGFWEVSGGAVSDAAPLTETRLRFFALNFSLRRSTCFWTLPAAAEIDWLRSLFWAWPANTESLQYTMISVHWRYFSDVRMMWARIGAESSIRPSFSSSFLARR